jgi:hypothetical protein
MSETVIEAQGLTKRYGEAKAVDGVSFSISLWPAGAERRGQDHHDPDDARIV